MSLKVRISSDVRCRNSKQVAVSGQVGTILRAALPFPEILATVFSTIVSIADEVGATEALEVELTSTLVENVL
jgi:hypothetical protein